MYSKDYTGGTVYISKMYIQLKVDFYGYYTSLQTPAPNFFD